MTSLRCILFPADTQVPEICSGRYVTPHIFTHIVDRVAVDYDDVHSIDAGAVHAHVYVSIEVANAVHRAHSNRSHLAVVHYTDVTLLILTIVATVQLL